MPPRRPIVLSKVGLPNQDLFDKRLHDAAVSITTEAFGKICGDCLSFVANDCDRVFLRLTTDRVRYDAVACDIWKLRPVMRTKSIEICSIAAHAAWFSYDPVSRFTWDKISDKQKLEMRRVVKFVMDFSSLDDVKVVDEINAIVGLMSSDINSKRFPTYLEFHHDADLIVATIVSILRSFSGT